MLLRSKFLTAPLLILLMLCFAKPSAAEPMPNEQIVRTIEGYTQAMRDGDYLGMARAMHPGDLRDFKELLATVGQSAENQGQFREFGALFPGVRNMEQFRAQTPEEVFARLMKAVVGMMPELRAILAGAEIQVLGAVTEGEDLIHVVHRMRMQVEGTTVTTIDVISLRKFDDRYFILIDEQVRGIATALQRQFGIEPEVPID